MHSGDQKQSIRVTLYSARTRTVLLLALVAVLVWSERTSLYDLAVQLKVVPLPETFTELYFVQQPTVTRTATVGTSTVATTTVTYSFAVHNVSSAKKYYTARVELDSGKGLKHAAARYMITLAPNEIRTIHDVLENIVSTSTGMLNISLEGSDQKITFRLQ
jgi:hypothetical protein